MNFCILESYPGELEEYPWMHFPSSILCQLWHHHIRPGDLLLCPCNPNPSSTPIRVYTPSSPLSSSSPSSLSPSSSPSSSSLTSSGSYLLFNPNQSIHLPFYHHHHHHHHHHHCDNDHHHMAMMMIIISNILIIFRIMLKIITIINTLHFLNSSINTTMDIIIFCTWIIFSFSWNLLESSRNSFWNWFNSTYCT